MATKRIFHRVLLFFLIPLICAVPDSSSWADALDNWRPANVSTNPIGYRGLLLRNVTYGNGRYVAVGEYASDDRGVVQTSDDGVNWTLQTYPYYSVLNLFDVAYGNGVFAAVGWDYYSGRNIYTSTNGGVNWTPHQTALSGVAAVTFGRGAFGADQFVAVGSATRTNNVWPPTTYNVYASASGTTWTAWDSEIPVNLYDVASGAGRFVAAADGHNILTSDDGYWWWNTFDERAGIRVSFCNGRFFLSSGPGTNLVSTDGLNWSVLVNTTSNTFERVVYARGAYLALSYTDLFRSTDGTNWIQCNLELPSSAMWSGVVFGEQNAVVVGYASAGFPILPLAYVSDPFVDLEMEPGTPPQLKISGLVGNNYRIEYRVDSPVGPNNWTPLASFTLTNSPMLWPDLQATNSSRFYRAVLLP